MKKWVREAEQEAVKELELAQQEKHIVESRTSFYRSIGSYLRDMRQENNFGPRLKEAFKSL